MELVSPETSLFRSRSDVVRFSRKTSHSSMRRMARHLVDSSSTLWSWCSTSPAVLPSSPALIEYKGFFISSATFISQLACLETTIET